MKVIIDCSLGNSLPAEAESTDNALAYGCEACEFINNNRIHRCNKFICVAGTTPDGKDVDEWRCSEAWIPMLLVENSMTNRGQTAAIESARNENVTRLGALNKILTSASNKQIG